MTDTLYRVRDRNTAEQMGTIWGENLTDHAAQLLKEQVVGGGKSRTARVEPMSADPDVIGEPETKLQHARDVGYVVNTHQPIVHPAPVRRPHAPARGAAPPAPFKTGDRPVIDLSHPNLVVAREAAAAAARVHAQEAQARADQLAAAAQTPDPATPPAALPDFDDHDLDGLEDDSDPASVNLDELHLDAPASGDDAGT